MNNGNGTGRLIVGSFGKITDRRTKIRFPVEQEISYRVIHSRSTPVSGIGTTVNIGSRGILFTTHEKLTVGCTVKMSMNWPAKLGCTCPLRFAAVGRVIRSEDNQAAVRIHRYEFTPVNSETLDGIPDRRASSRFPVQEEVSYHLTHSRSAPVTGRGAALNIGSGGILFTTNQKLDVGRAVEVAMNWPAKLGGTCPLRFIAVGRVVRSVEDQAAVRIQRYEFKTRSQKAEQIPTAPARLHA
jgi:ribosomal protein L2